MGQELSVSGAARERRGLQTLTGVLLDGDPLYADYLTQHAEKLLHIAEGLRRSGREDALHRAEAAEALAQQIEEKRKTL